MADPAILHAQDVAIQAAQVQLEGSLTIPEGSSGLVIFAHGSGSSRLSPRNRAVARTLNDGGLSTLLLDLLTRQEQEIDERSGDLRFNIDLLARRLLGTIDWAVRGTRTAGMRIGLFGASTGAAASLVAAAGRPAEVGAVVSRGGRADMAAASLPLVAAPTLLLVGGNDPVVVRLNQEAAAMLRAPHQLQIIPEASHLFEEPGKLQLVAELAREWFARHLLRGTL